MEPSNLLEIRKNNFIRMRKLAEQQVKLINSGSGRMEELFLLIDKRERLKNEIDADSKKYNSLARKSRDNKFADKSRTINLEITEVIESIRDLDKKVEDFVTGKKNAFIQDIARIKKGRRAVRSYGNRGTNSPRFIESKG